MSLFWVVPEEPASRAKSYSNRKLFLSLTSTVLSFLLIVGILVSGISAYFESIAVSFTSSAYLELIIYAALFGIVNSIISFPLNFYSSYILEHRYQLSNQTLFQWLWEHLKGFLVSLPIALPLGLIFYYFLREFQSFWWLAVACIMFFVSVILARVAPVVIFPLFYKFAPLADGSLKEHIVMLCEKAGVHIKGIFTFNLSKTTKKANAGFTGIGRSKRIILGDTLMEHFSEDEIESVFAHELGHYKHGHLWKGMFAGTVSIFVGLYLTSLLYAVSLGWFGFDRVDRLAALPLLVLWLGLYSIVTMPLTNLLSRKHEFEADRYAVNQTKNKPAFISTMQKLASMNLADTTPNKFVESLFYSHPSIEKRIRAAEEL
jgi:STE24 endopeptidase